MKKIFLPIATLFTNLVCAQSPPSEVTFPPTTQLCDPEPWKLVFFDDFSGTSIDNTKWRNYTSWIGTACPPGEIDDASDARWELGTGAPVIYKDNNIQVSGGTCKLIFKHDHSNWKCATCSDAQGHHANFSSAKLVTYWRNQSTCQANTYNSGKLEARIKMPTFNRAHSTFWTWSGQSGAVNEIDIAEAYGDPYWPSKMPGDNNRFCNYSLHSWGDHHTEIRNHYPNQAWLDYVKGRFFRQQDWHVYTCEWDPNVITFYIDGVRVNTFWKYYWKARIFRIGTSCLTPSGAPTTYKILPGFPWDTDSKSNVLLTVWKDADEVKTGLPIHDTTAVYELGRMEIDYVKIWQRHPESDNHIDLCNQNIPMIVGPDIICSSGTAYNMSTNSNAGIWMGTSNLSYNGSTSSSTYQPTTTTSDWGIVRYWLPFVAGGCPAQYVTKTVDVGPPKKPTVAIVTTRTTTPSGIKVSYNLTAQRSPSPGGFSAALTYGAPAPSKFLSPTTFEWDVDYGYNASVHYHGYGQYISLPSVAATSNMSIHWTLTVTNACGAVTSSGMTDTRLKTTEDTATDYFSAIITDSTAYATAVQDRIDQTMVEDTTDTVAINSLLEQIKFEELGPYIIYDSSFVFPSEDTTTIDYYNNQRLSEDNSPSTIYPNPTEKILQIKPGSGYDVNTPVQVRIIDYFGNAFLVEQYMIHNGTIELDIKGLATSVYILEISQRTKVERFRFSKI